jgi:Na+-translocating ferredoxin:NAD+ oxidoreductase RnfC subunit
MTQDEILETVREAGGSDVGGHGWTTWVGTQSTEFLERFAKLVAAKEREACAKLVEPWLLPEYVEKIRAREQG